MFRTLMIVMVTLLAVLVWAQPNPADGNAAGGAGGRGGQNGMGGPGGPGGPGRGQNTTLSANNTALEITANGVFIIHNGVVAKYAADLKAGGSLELFGALPAQPKLPENPTDADRTAVREWMNQLNQRSASFAELAKDDMLYIVVGTKFFRVNQKTLALEAQGEIGTAAAENNGRPMGMAAFTPPPMLKLENGTLYVLSAQEFVAVNAVNGKVLTRAALPQTMTPAVDWQALTGMWRGNGQNGPGGQNGRGGQGGQGGRGGQGGQGGQGRGGQGGQNNQGGRGENNGAQN